MLYHTGLCERIIPFGRDCALQNSSRNSSPAPYLMFVKLIIPRVFLTGGVFVSQTPVSLYVTCNHTCYTALPSWRYLEAERSHASWIWEPQLIISYHVISYHIIPYHTIPFHTISYHIISYRIILWCDVKWYCHVMSYYVALLRNSREKASHTGHTCVCEQKVLRRRRPVGKVAWETPNQGLDNGFCRCIARRRLM